MKGENAIDPDSKFRRTPPFGNDSNNNNTGNRCQKGNQIAVIKIGATENGKNMQFPEKKKEGFRLLLRGLFRLGKRWMWSEKRSLYSYLVFNLGSILGLVSNTEDREPRLLLRGLPPPLSRTLSSYFIKICP